MKKIGILLLIVLNILNIFDAITTKISLDLGAKELNPLMDYLINLTSIYIFIIIKIILVLLASILFYIYINKIILVLLILVYIYVLVVSHNIIGIINLKGIENEYCKKN